LRRRGKDLEKAHKINKMRHDEKEVKSIKNGNPHVFGNGVIRLICVLSDTKENPSRQSLYAFLKFSF